MKTGQLIRSLRKDRGLTQAQLAEEICHRSTLNSFENKNSATSFEDLYKYLQRLNVSLEEVKYLLQENKLTTKQEISLADYVSWLTNAMAVINQKGFSQIYSLFSAIMLVVFSGIALLQFNVSLLVAAMLLSIVIILAPRPLNKKISEKAKKVSLSSENLTRVSANSLGGFDTLFNLNKTKLILKEIAKAYEQFKEDNINYTKTFAWLQLLLNSSSLLAQTTIFFINCLLIFAGEVTIGSVKATGQLAGNFF